MNPAPALRPALAVLATCASLLLVVPASSAGTAEAAGAAAADVARPTPPPTKGFVTGRVLSADGKPVVGALVTGVRFSDLGLPVDRTEEKLVLARTDSQGRFRLPQLRERYLVRVCDEQDRNQDCDREAATKTFAPTYVGPDGARYSWVKHTRLFSPKPAGRSLGVVRAKVSAVLTGTFREGGPYRSVHLTRGDGSIADTVQTDEAGRYRFEVAPGRYRVEADRHEGLRTVATLPGFRSGRLALKAGANPAVSFRTHDAGVLRGIVTAGGKPVADQFLAVLEQDGDFAAGVVTDPKGRYVVASLKPGGYTVNVPNGVSRHLPVTRTVDVSKGSPTRADLKLVAGGVIKLAVADPGGNGAVDIEVRNAAGRAVKVYQGGAGEKVVFAGLPTGTYDVFARRFADPTQEPEQTVFPWTKRTVTVTGTETQQLGSVALTNSTVNLTGTLPPHAQVKITAVPEDGYRREAHVKGGDATPMSVNWTEQADAEGHYVVRGIVPGTYTVTVTTPYVSHPDGSTGVGGNLATTRHTVTVEGSAPTADFSAPQGQVVTGRMRYAGTTRPVIAPVGFAVVDSGDPSWLFPTHSLPQQYGGGFRVTRLHPGPATGRLLDKQAAYDRTELIPEQLMDSSRLAEPGTPYWISAKPRSFTVVAGEVLDLGWIDVTVRG